MIGTPRLSYLLRQASPLTEPRGVNQKQLDLSDASCEYFLESSV